MTTETSKAGNVHCGIAGWSYPDWDGYVYPRGTRDKLRYIAEYVDMIEINSTFYRPPSARVAASWLRRTEDLPGFFFTAKIHQDVTHRGIIASSTVTAFRDGLAPLGEAGRLRHLLAQFRYDFADNSTSRRLLEDIREQFGGIADHLAVEVRHNSWQSDHAVDFLRGLDVTVANLDYPTARDSFNLRLCDIGSAAYLRLHGRNRQAWFSKAGRDETYNYCYQGPELDDIVDRAVKLAGMSTHLTLVANNHYQGKEAVNILQIKAAITGENVPVPPMLRRQYPQLEEIAKLLPDFGQGNLL